MYNLEYNREIAAFVCRLYGDEANFLFTLIIYLLNLMGNKKLLKIGGIFSFTRFREIIYFFEPNNLLEEG